MSNSMTKQHFKALAGALKAVRPNVKIRKNSPTYRAWQRCVVSVAIECNTFNHNFDYHKFYKACKLEG